MEKIEVSKEGFEIVLEVVQNLINYRIGSILTEYDWRDLASVEKILLESKK